MAHDVMFDMETADPDDGFTLALLATHPWATLRAVTVTPGTRAQVAVVRRILEEAGARNIAVGARDPGSIRDAVSGFHWSYLGAPGEAEPDGLGHEVLARTLRRFPEATLLTGAPLQNLGLLLTHHPEARLQRWVAQGGFAGDPVVAPEHRLPKFAGRSVCPTFNFNGDPAAALMALSSDRIALRQLVSKNVCHGVCYDQAFHERLTPLASRTAGLALLHRAMGIYLRKHPGGKLLHDPLAACVMLAPGVVALREVEVYRAKGGWGSTPAEGTRTFISVSVDPEAFFRVLVGEP
jgi:inosine-uridine nucleoside N-ribohydrolase